MRKPFLEGRMVVNKNRAIIGVVLLLTAFALTAYLLPRYLAGRQVVYPILTAKRDIPPGCIISEADISVSKTMDKSLSEIAYTTAESVIGKSSTKHLLTGRYIFYEDVAESYTVPTIYNTLPEGRLLISVSTPSLACSAAGQIRANDIIRLYSLDENGSAITPPELQYIKVLAVYNSQGLELSKSYSASKTHSTSTVDGLFPENETSSPSSEDHETPAVISLLVTQEQALRLIELEKSGSHYISLVSRDSEDQELAYLKQQDNVLKNLTKGMKG